VPEAAPTADASDPTSPDQARVEASTTTTPP
jgi:hypothetical protein